MFTERGRGSLKTPLPLKELLAAFFSSKNTLGVGWWLCPTNILNQTWVLPKTAVRRWGYEKQHPGRMVQLFSNSKMNKHATGKILSTSVGPFLSDERKNPVVTRASGPGTGGMGRGHPCRLV